MPRSVVVASVVIVALAAAPGAHASFPGRNGDIAFSRVPSYLRIVSPDGVMGAKLGRGFAPAWSPDGTRVALQEGSDIWTVAPDGSDRQLLAAGDELLTAPAWSPDGGHIVAVHQADALADTELMVMPSEEGPLGVKTLITDSPGNEDTPAWSPDGTMIAYSYHICGDGGCGSRIAVYDIGAAARRFVTRKIFANEVTPDWSPDSSSIVFASNRHNPRGWWDLDVYTVPAVGGDVTRVLTARGSARNGAPVWSPDGTRLLYTHETRDGAFSLRTIRWDGTGERRLSQLRSSVDLTQVGDWLAIPPR